MHRPGEIRHVTGKTEGQEKRRERREDKNRRKHVALDSRLDSRLTCVCVDSRLTEGALPSLFSLSVYTHTHRTRQIHALRRIVVFECGHRDSARTHLVKIEERGAIDTQSAHGRQKDDCRKINRIAYDDVKLMDALASCDLDSITTPLSFYISLSTTCPEVRLVSESRRTRDIASTFRPPRASRRYDMARCVTRKTRD